MKKRVYRNDWKNWPWDLWEVSWVGPFFTTKADHPSDIIFVVVPKIESCGNVYFQTIKLGTPSAQSSAQSSS